MAPTELSIVCFRWKGSDEFNKNLMSLINQKGNYIIGDTILKGKFVLRICIIHLTLDVTIIEGLIDEIKQIGSNLEKEK